MSKSEVASPVIVIIGGGPAGMGCALWLKNLGFTPVIIEKGTNLGGQARVIKRINQWFLGHIDKPASEIVAAFAQHMQHKSIAQKLQYTLVNIKFLSSGMLELFLETADRQQEKLLANALVIATGQSAKNEKVFANICGFNETFLTDQIRYFPLDHLDMQEQIKGKRVAVLGGGDNAYCTALDLLQHTKKVSLIMRSQPRAQSKFQYEYTANLQPGSVEQLMHTEIIRFNQQDSTLELVLKQLDGSQSSIIVDWVFTRFGFTPTTAFVKGIPSLKNLQLDTAGYIHIDTETRTSMPAIYAIGDVTNLQPASIINAVAHGAAAARTIESDLRKYN